MADVAENLRAYMLTSTPLKALTSHIAENKVPQPTPDKYIWVAQNGKVYDQTTDDAAGVAPRSVLFDCECCAKELRDSVAIADEVRALFPYRGTFGDMTIKGAFVNDQSEDYTSVNEMADDGIHSQSLQIEICP
jgi:hypothetical protein